MAKFSEKLSWDKISDCTEEKQEYLTVKNGAHTLTVGRFNHILGESQTYSIDELEDGIIQVTVLQHGKIVRRALVDNNDGGKFTLERKTQKKVKKVPPPPYSLVKKESVDPSYLVIFRSGGFLEVKCIDEKGKKKLCIISKKTDHVGSDVSDLDPNIGTKKFYRKFAYDKDTTKVELTAGKEDDTHILTLTTIDKGVPRTSSWVFNVKKNADFRELSAKRNPMIIQVIDGGFDLENLILAAAKNNPIMDVHNALVSNDVWKFCNSSITLEGMFHLGGFWLIGNFKNGGNVFKVVLHITADSITACYGQPGETLIKEVPHNRPEWLNKETYVCHFEQDRAALSKHVIDMLTLTGVKNYNKKKTN